MDTMTYAILALVAIAVIGCVYLYVSHVRSRRDRWRRSIYGLTEGHRHDGTSQELRRLVKFHGWTHITTVTISYDATQRITSGELDDDEALDRIASIIGMVPDGDPIDGTDVWEFHYVRTTD